MANLSKIKREKMLEYLEKLKEINNDDENIRAITEIENALNEKKYGLIWEEHSEKVDEMLEHNIPIFVEEENRKIIANEDEPYNFLLEGDNLHSLKLLEKTHKGKIDVIYIDPPYNTGNKDFIYDDSFVDKTDGYSHSKWLSFMEKRLLIARDLLSDIGVIFISIDDNEHAQLKLLCDSVFCEDNFVTSIHWKRSESQNNSAKQFAIVGEFILCYAINKANRLFNKITLQDTAIKEYRYVDEVTGKKFRRGTIVDNTRGKNILDIVSPSGIKKRIKSIRNKQFFEEKNNNGEIYWTSTGTPYLKIFLDESDGQISNNWFDNAGVNEDASEQLRKLNVDFSFSKPTSLITKLLEIAGNNKSIVLDFFAGSGTTGHAVMQLNKEDSGNRQYILCTNNENNICEEVTYQRLKNIQEELPHNLKYYKTEFIPKFSDDEESISEKMMEHTRELIELEHAIELDGKKYIIIYEEDKLDEIIFKIENGGKLFVRSGIFLSRSNQRILEEKCVRVIEIPEYYFREELKEVGEL